jgi:hypothetical protein
VSIQLESLKDIVEHIEQFGTTPLFYRKGNEFVILAARLSWRGDVTSEDLGSILPKPAVGKKTGADLLEDYLRSKGAKKIRSYVDFDTLFAGGSSK